MWEFEVRTTTKWITSAVIDADLNYFVQKCDPNAKVSEKNIEKWILRYLMEERGYSSSEIKSLDVKLKG